MYIMISPIYADVNKLSKKIMAHLGKNKPSQFGLLPKKTRKTRRKNITRVVLPRKDGSFETEMQVARFDDGGVGTVASFQLPLW